VNILFLSPPWAERDDVSRIASEAGHVPILVDTAAQALARAAQSGTDMVLLDLAAGAEALRFLRKATQMRVPLPVVAIADRRTPDASIEALRLGVADIIGRPLRPDDLIAAFANAHEFSRLTERAPAHLELAQPADGVFGASPAMRDVLGIVRRVAQSRCSVLIVGERGTGRETIARAIRDQGPRKDSVFIKFMCSDIDPAAFAAALDPATFQKATLYLEDLGELPMDMQLRLEARLAEGGEDGPRVLGAPQPRIAERVERGVFRPTLLEAISVVRIDLPPLRQRAQDIPLLATHFLKDACKRHDAPAKAFSRGALSLLAALPWPGNAAELRALTERLAILVPRGVVLLEDVLANVRLDAAEAIGSERGSLKEARERFERDYVTAVLQHHRGRMGAAAKELGIERTNLYRKIKQLKIQWTLPD
jgi:two-component system nitrogen regulation response regulator NtrX